MRQAGGDQVTRAGAAVIVIVAFFLVGWAAAVPVKYIALVAASFVVIMALYEGIIRRIGVLRFLFGMKGHKR